MKFKVKVVDFLEAVNKAAATVDKSKDTVTGSLLITAVKSGDTQALYLYSTNVTAETTVKIDAQVEVVGKTLVDLDKLRVQLLNRDPEAVAEVALIPASEGKSGVKRPARIQVKVGRSQVHLSYDDKNIELMTERMQLMPFRQNGHYKISGKDMGEFVRRASFCIPKEGETQDSRTLTGMRLLSSPAGYEAHATNGFTCARIVVKGVQSARETGNTMVPQSALKPLCDLIKKEDDVLVIEGNKNERGHITKLYFKIGTSVFFGTNLLSGNMPDVGYVIRQYDPEFVITVNRTVLKQALVRAGAFDDEHWINIEVSPKTLKLSARSKETSNDFVEELEVEIKPELVEGFVTKAVFNLAFFESAVTSSTQESIQLGIHDWSDKVKKARPLVVDDSQQTLDARYLLMPIYDDK